MRHRLLLPGMLAVTLLAPSLCVRTAAQTSKSLRAKFGPPAKSSNALEMYEISANIKMRVKYANDKQACEVEIYQNGLWWDDEQGEKVGNIIKELAPTSERGKRIPNHKGRAEDCITSRTEEYEKVAITYFNQPCGKPFRVVTIDWKNRRCG